jgi:hypothetical protein
MKHNAYRVKLKNAIMQTWNEIKEDNKAPSLQDAIDKILDKQRKEKNKNKGDAEEKEREEKKEKK